MRLLCLLAPALLFPGIGASPVATDDAPNVLVVFMDDIGVDRVGAYGAHPNSGKTPTIDWLAQRGALYRSAWAQTVCTPSRACLLTGLTPSESGIGWNMQADGSHWLTADHVTLPETLSVQGIESWAYGKWHLSRAIDDPRVLGGFDHYQGSLFNLGPEWGSNGYYDYIETHDGFQQHVIGNYATTELVDDFLAALPNKTEPWFSLLALHAPHGPWHAPPPHLTTYYVPDPPTSDIPLAHRAAVQALDSELRRVLDALAANTYVIVMGDNGTPPPATDAPFDPEHAKGTMYQGGIHVPLIVAGPAVVPGERHGLVQITDLFATILDMLAVDGARPPNSISFFETLSQPDHRGDRSVATAHRFRASQDRRAARDARYKLIRRSTGLLQVEEELYDLLLDPLETADLLVGPPLGSEAQQAYLRLGAVLDDL